MDLINTPIQAAQPGENATHEKAMKLMSLLFVVLFAVTTKGQEMTITSFMAGDGNVDSVFNLAAQPLKLTYRQTNVTIGIAGARDPVSPGYRFRLRGLEQHWHKGSGSTAIFYTNLFGGNYEFEIVPVNAPGKAARLRFIIEEAFWQRP